MARFLKPLDRNTRLAHRRIGGKAANILKMKRIGEVKTPDSWVILTEALGCFFSLHYRKSEGVTLLEKYLKGDLALNFYARLAHKSLPEQLLDELVSALPSQSFVIVRSSGIAEDDKFSSLAGHYASIICATDRLSLSMTIKTCWLVGLKVYLDQLLAKRDDDIATILDKALGSIALVIQHLVDAEKSGVLFSRSPLQPDKALIVASYGTCHSVVDGSMVTDTYVLDRGKLDQYRINYKFEMTVLGSATGYFPGQEVPTPLGPTVFHQPYKTDHVLVTRVPERYSQESTLNESELDELARAAEILQTELGYPVDIEWSFIGGTLIVLQVRPITAIADRPIETTLDTEYAIASPGRAYGPVKIVLSPHDSEKIDKGDIIAVIDTDPDFMPIFYLVGGIVSENGSPLSHTAIVARELKIPCLVGVRNATRGLFREGQRIGVDADNGRIVVDPGFTLAKEVTLNAEVDRVVYDAQVIGRYLDNGGCTLAFSGLYQAYREENPDVVVSLSTLTSFGKLLLKRHKAYWFDIFFDVLDDRLEFHETILPCDLIEGFPRRIGR